MFKGNGNYKYGCGLLETLIQGEVLPGPMSLRLVWNRFFNSYSKSDTNIPLDLAVRLILLCVVYDIGDRILFWHKTKGMKKKQNTIKVYTS